MKIFKDKRTRVFIIIMGTLFIIAGAITYFYYDYQDKYIDPRTIEAYAMYEKYNELARNSDYEAIFQLMNSIEDIYTKTPHYAESYEVGVLYNNRAAAYVAMAISPAINDSIVKDSLFNLAKINTSKSIEIYTDWLDKWQGKNQEEVKEMLKPHFNENDAIFKNQEIEKYINRRAKQIEEARLETPRRLSVSYTNKGIIYRHKGEYELAALEYFKALELWPDNLAAENNLSILLDKPVKKRSLLRRFFPKSRIE